MNRRKKIGIVTAPFLFSEYISELFAGVGEVARQCGVDYCLVTHEIDGPRSLLEDIRESRCAGVLITHPQIMTDELAEVLDSDLNVIVLDGPSYPSPTGFINHNGASGIRQVIDHLYGLGHRSIGFVMGRQDNSSWNGRLKGYMEGLEACGLEVREEYICRTSHAHQLEAVGSISSLLRSYPELTALVCCDDLFALTAIRGAANIGMSVPRDLSVTGFDNTIQASMNVPSLTSVDHRLQEEAGMAVRQLVETLMNPEKRLPQLTLPASVVIRESTGPAPKR